MSEQLSACILAARSAVLQHISVTWNAKTAGSPAEAQLVAVTAAGRSFANTGLPQQHRMLLQSCAIHIQHNAKCWQLGHTTWPQQLHADWESLLRDYVLWLLRSDTQAATWSLPFTQPAAGPIGSWH